MKRKRLLKGCVLLLAFAFCTTNVSAQGFLKKLQNATEKVMSVTGSSDAKASSEEEEKASEKDSISTEEFLTNVPSYTVKKVIETDSLGNAITNEDGTTRYKYLLIDKNGNVCAANTAKKHLNSALKSGAMILLKVGGGATAGALIGKKAGGSKKSALIGAGIGAAAGLLGSANDIKEVRKQMKLMKECKHVLSAYQKTFTEEGTPIDASVDLTDVDGINFTECEEITKTSADVRNEFLASMTEGESLEDVELPDDLSI